MHKGGRLRAPALPIEVVRGGQYFLDMALSPLLISLLVALVLARAIPHPAVVAPSRRLSGVPFIGGRRWWSAWEGFVVNRCTRRA